MLLAWAIAGLAAVTASFSPVSVQVFYKTNCPHCNAFVNSQVLPLLEAEIPGDRLQLTLLPYFDSGKPGSKEECVADPSCRDVLAPICALKGTLPPPAASDSPSLLRAARFVACDLRHSAGGLVHNMESIADCTRQADLQWLGPGGMQACRDGKESFELLITPENYAEPIMRVVHDFLSAGYPEQLPMPWVLIDGEMLGCSGEGCSSRRTPRGDVPLAGAASSFLALVCAKLEEPRPSACAQLAPASRTVSDSGAKAKAAPPCEDCYALGRFHWSNRPERSSFSAAPLASLALLAAVSAMCVSAWRRGRRSDCSELAAE